MFLKSLCPRRRTLHPFILTSNKFHPTTHSSTNAFQIPLTSLQCGHLLQSLSNSKSLRKGRQLHAHIISSGLLLNNTYLTTKLTSLYAISGDLTDAQVLFNGITLKSSFLWNVMVRGYACNGSSMESMVLYREMLGFGKRPDNFTYPFVLMACGDVLLVKIGKVVHCEIIVCGYASDVFVGNSLISMYSKFREMDIACKVFDKMPVRDPTSWNTVISGCARNSYPKKALSIFSELAKRGDRLNRAAFLSVLPACANLSALKQGKEIHAYILRSCIEFNEFLVNALIDVYINSNFTVGSRRLFDKMTRRDTVSWNSMISGYARHGDVDESLELFHQMNMEDLGPDEVTFTAVLGACGRIAALQFGMTLHANLIRKGFGTGVTVGTALIDMYAKCGSLDSSLQAFDEIPNKNLISWSAMVSGYSLHGMGRDAFACFCEMKEQGIRPDKITFTSLLSACSHGGLVHEGKQIFSQMSLEYGIKPSMEHYSCIVDLLGRAGHLDEAYELIMNMEIEPSEDVWAALLSACRIHRNAELAEIAAQNALNLKSKSVSVYISLSNIYAAEKRWDDVERVRAHARQHRLRKPPGCSFVESGMAIHQFLVGDKSHPQSESIYAKLDELRQQLKEDMLWDHSERLAIAFALLNACTGSIIRITKNLRVCSDCHTVTKLISKNVGREIIVRDARRFHHFKNGSCSCGDSW